MWLRRAMVGMLESYPDGVKPRGEWKLRSASGERRTTCGRCVAKWGAGHALVVFGGQFGVPVPYLEKTGMQL